MVDKSGRWYTSSFNRDSGWDYNGLTIGYDGDNPFCGILNNNRPAPLKPIYPKNILTFLRWKKEKI